jgi:hypothetical protein
VKKRFLAYFSMVIGLKLKLITDMKSESSKENTLYFSGLNIINTEFPEIFSVSFFLTYFHYPPKKLLPEDRNCIRAILKFLRVAEQPLTKDYAQTHLRNTN